MEDENKSRGWTRIYRSIDEHWIFSSEPVNYFQAWIDLINMANWKERTISVNKKLVKVHPGQRWTSIRKLMERWKWSQKRVTHFLDPLEQEGMIYRQSEQGVGTLITIVKYEDYQGLDEKSNTLGNTPSNTLGNTSGNTQRDTQRVYKQESKNIKKLGKDGLEDYDASLDPDMEGYE